MGGVGVFLLTCLKSWHMLVRGPLKKRGDIPFENERPMGGGKPAHAFKLSIPFEVLETFEETSGETKQWI